MEQTRTTLPPTADQIAAVLRDPNTDHGREGMWSIVLDSKSKG